MSLHNAELEQLNWKRNDEEMNEMILKSVVYSC